MDENESALEVTSQKHDGWDVLVLTLLAATQVTGSISDYLFRLTVLACEHKNHLVEQDKFREIVGRYEMER